MDCYLVLAGGYWHLSQKADLGGYHVDQNDPGKATVDYVVRVVGLPERFVKPMDVVDKERYYCKSCKRYVTESEIEQRTGCWTAKGHDLEREVRKVEVWENGIKDRYEPEKVRWMKPAYRLFLNTSKGIDYWRDIWRYIHSVFPPTKRLVPDLLPIAVGDRHQFNLMEDDVPTINLSGVVEEEVKEEAWAKDPKPVIKEEPAISEELIINDGEDEIKMVECDICGKSVKANTLNQHRWGKHKKKKGE